MLPACFAHGPGLHGGHSSSDGKRTPVGSDSFGSCMVHLCGGPAPRGKEWHSVVAQRWEGAPCSGHSSG